MLLYILTLLRCFTTGEEHYNCISALHKSMRGSDANAAIYWLARMLEAGEDPRYVARRMIRFAGVRTICAMFVYMRHVVVQRLNMRTLEIKSYGLLLLPPSPFTFAAEDVGLADPNALLQAVSAHQSAQLIGMPECTVILAQCAVYLARAPKSNALEVAYNKAKQCIAQSPAYPGTCTAQPASSRVMLCRHFVRSVAGGP